VTVLPHVACSKLTPALDVRLCAVLCVQVIEHHLRGRDYNEALLPQWINDICESCMEELHAPKKPFKYIGQPESTVQECSPSVCLCLQLLLGEAVRG